MPDANLVYCHAEAALGTSTAGIRWMGVLLCSPAGGGLRWITEDNINEQLTLLAQQLSVATQTKKIYIYAAVTYEISLPKRGKLIL